MHSARGFKKDRETALDMKTGLTGSRYGVSAAVCCKGSALLCLPVFLSRRRHVGALSIVTYVGPIFIGQLVSALIHITQVIFEVQE